ncbi:MAG: hypothetical protein ACREBC_26345, partial [Pyrinomonadaceae bacterium]
MSPDVEVFRQEFQTDYGIPAIGDRPAPVPIERSFQDPNDPLDEINKCISGLISRMHSMKIGSCRAAMGD